MYIQIYMEEFFEKLELLNTCFDKYRTHKDLILNKINSLTPRNKEEMNSIICKIDRINEKINDISNDIEELQYKLDTNEIISSIEVEERIKEHKINKIIYDTFSPYMLLYSIMLNNK